jgi:hypothetical protein
MNRIGRLALIGFVAAIVFVGLGYAWGASGRRAAQALLDDTRGALDAAAARSHVLEARVSLYNMNFGDASRQLEEAKVPLRRLRQSYVDEGRDSAVRGVSAAHDRVDAAQRLSGKLDQSANSKAGEALEAIRVATSR